MISRDNLDNCSRESTLARVSRDDSGPPPAVVPIKTSPSWKAAADLPPGVAAHLSHQLLVDNVVRFRVRTRAGKDRRSFPRDPKVRYPR